MVFSETNGGVSCLVSDGYIQEMKRKVMLSTVVVLLLKLCKGIINLDREECIIVKKTFSSSLMIAVRKLHVCVYLESMYIYRLQHNVQYCKHTNDGPESLCSYFHLHVVSKRQKVHVILANERGKLLNILLKIKFCKLQKKRHIKM